MDRIDLTSLEEEEEKLQANQKSLLTSANFDATSHRAKSLCPCGEL
jgi:hypothetical protein